MSSAAPPLTATLLSTRHIMRPTSAASHTVSHKQKLTNHRWPSAAPPNHKMTQYSSRTRLSKDDSQHRAAPLCPLWAVLMFWWGQLLLSHVVQAIPGQSGRVQTLVQVGLVDSKLCQPALSEDTGCRCVCLVVCRLRTDDVNRSCWFLLLQQVLTPDGVIELNI